MKCCTEKTKKILVFGGGIFFALLALILGLLWPSLSKKLLKSQLVIKEGSKNYEQWLVTPIPIYLEVFMFNWTNSEDVHNSSIKPHFEEIGPYVFREEHRRVDLEWHKENDTVSFNQTRTWHFEPSRTNGSLDDLVTSVNVITATVAYTIRDKNAIFKWFVNTLMREKNEGLFITKSVRELLFDGYDDPLLKFLKAGHLEFNIPFTEFGWFVDRNKSSSYDGRFNMHTGADDISKLGIIDLWNYENVTSFYRGNCGKVNGSSGELFPPLDLKDDLTIFATDICRSVSVKPDKAYSLFGINGQKWIGDDRVFDNGLKHPEAECFCTSDPVHCPDIPYGVMNVSSCKFGAPAFVSFPHFYLAAPSYLRGIEGLNPSKEKHEFYVAMEPTTGIPLEIKAQMQINIYIQPIEHLDVYHNVPHLMVPMFWFRQIASLDKNLAGQAKIAILLPDLGIYVAAAFGGLGVLLVFIGIACTVLRLWGKHDDELLLQPSDHIADDDILR